MNSDDMIAGASENVTWLQGELQSLRNTYEDLKEEYVSLHKQEAKCTNLKARGTIHCGPSLTQRKALNTSPARV